LRLSNIKSTDMEEIRRFRNILFIAGLLLVTGLMEVRAQETILAGGGNATGNGGTASYSIGQVFYCVHLMTGGSIAEGVQQPYEVYVISGTEESNVITLSCRAYPNPVTGFLFLKTGYTENLPLFYRLIDNNGRMLLNQRITGDECVIPMESYAEGIYYLHVMTTEKNIRTFKIIKH